MLVGSFDTFVVLVVEVYILNVDITLSVKVYCLDLVKDHLLLG